MGSESTGFKQAPGDVVGEVPEAQGGAAEVLEAPVDRFGWAVAGTGAVEERKNVGRALFQGAAGVVERVAGATTMPSGVLLNALPAPVQSVAGEADDMER